MKIERVTGVFMDACVGRLRLLERRQQHGCGLDVSPRAAMSYIGSQCIGGREIRRRSDTNSKKAEASKTGPGTPMLHIGGSGDTMYELREQGEYRGTNHAVEPVVPAHQQGHGITTYPCLRIP